MKTTGKNPPKWHQVYPQGTIAGNEEYKLFIALARHPKYQWRSVASLAKESGLSKKRVEEILNKYYKLGMVFQSDKNEENWAYWERVPEMLAPATVTVSAKDQDKRIAKAKQVLGTGGSSSGSSGKSSGKASSGGLSGAGMPATQDDDDDDAPCIVRPMGASKHVLKMEDEKCGGTGAALMDAIAAYNEDPDAPNPWTDKRWVYTAFTRQPVGGEKCANGMTYAENAAVLKAASQDVYSEGELADIAHLEKIAYEASSQTVRNRALAALEARGASKISVHSLKADGPQSEDVIARLRARLDSAVKLGHVTVKVPVALPSECEFGALIEEAPVAAKLSLKDLLKGAESVSNSTLRRA